MRLLLDTQVFLWLMWGRNLSQAAVSSLLDNNNKLYLSVASYWEICIKVSVGKLALEPEWPQTFAAEMSANDIIWLPIEAAHCRKIIELPFIHSDPFDRILIAQALCEDMTLLTADSNIRQYPLSTLW